MTSMTPSLTSWPWTSETVRCSWGEDPAMVEYHDHEWGREIRDERGLFERMCLESFQSGLSWLIILRKRERFREVFDGFDPAAVAAFGPDDVDRLLGDAGIVRNRRKIEAAIVNANVVLDLDGGFGTLLWSFAPAPGPAPATMAAVPASTEQSVAMARELKRQGFCFFGPTTAYALMQATGMVNDHLAACVAREP